MEDSLWSLVGHRYSRNSLSSVSRVAHSGPKSMKMKKKFVFDEEIRYKYFKTVEKASNYYCSYWIISISYILLLLKSDTAFFSQDWIIVFHVNWTIRNANQSFSALFCILLCSFFYTILHIFVHFHVHSCTQIHKKIVLIIIFNDFFSGISHLIYIYIYMYKLFQQFWSTYILFPSQTRIFPFFHKKYQLRTFSER